MACINRNNEVHPPPKFSFAMRHNDTSPAYIHESFQSIDHRRFEELHRYIKKPLKNCQNDATSPL